jgi:DNA-binding response OmpR family regulator
MPKIALVEDDDTMRSLLRTLLEIEGFEVVAADPDEDPFNLVMNAKPDVLLLDVHLKTGNGISLLKTLRENENTCSLTVLMTSGMDLEDTCLKNGADGFLLKPYMPDELINWIRTAKSKLPHEEEL